MLSYCLKRLSSPNLCYHAVSVLNSCSVCCAKIYDLVPLQCSACCSEQEGIKKVCNRRRGRAEKAYAPVCAIGIVKKNTNGEMPPFYIESLLKDDGELKLEKDKQDGEKSEGEGTEDKYRSDETNRDEKDKDGKYEEETERDKYEGRTNASYEKKVDLQLEHNNNGTTDEKEHLGKSEGGDGESLTEEGKENDMVGKSITVDNEGLGDEITKNVISCNLSETTQTRIGLAKPLEEVIEGKEWTELKENHRKQDDGDNEKRSKRKVEDRDSDMEEEKSKDKTEAEKAETDKLNKSFENDLTATSIVKSSPIRNESIEAAEGDTRKWMDLELECFSGANGFEPRKLARPSSQPMTNNERILKTSIFSPAGLQGAVDNVTVADKEHMMNGLIEAHGLSSAETPSLSIPPLDPLVDQTAEVSQKPSHPDAKYLDEIYSVPKPEEWPPYDDQEWLFQGKKPRPKKPKVSSSEPEESPQVWSEAVWLESAGIYALPYVVPY